MRALDHLRFVSRNTIIRLAAMLLAASAFEVQAGSTGLIAQARGGPRKEISSGEGMKKASKPAAAPRSSDYWMPKGGPFRPGVHRLEAVAVVVR